MEEYTDEQIQEWSKEDLLNLPLEEIEELEENKRQLSAYATEKIRKMMENE